MPEKAKTEPRDYVVGKRTGPIEMELHGISRATSASRAIDQKAKGQGGRWVAVPVGNWTEEELTIEEREPIVRRAKIDPTKPVPAPAIVDEQDVAA